MSFELFSFRVLKWVIAIFKVGVNVKLNAILRGLKRG